MIVEKNGINVSVLSLLAAIGEQTDYQAMIARNDQIISMVIPELTSKTFTAMSITSLRRPLATLANQVNAIQPDYNILFTRHVPPTMLIKATDGHTVIDFLEITQITTYDATKGHRIDIDANKIVIGKNGRIG